MYHNNSNNLEATFVKLSEKSNILFLYLLMFGNNSLLFCHCGGKKSEKDRFVINEI